MRPGGPRFDLRIDPGGYVWWYLDGLSDDGRHGVTIIIFVGSVFSPYYAWARRRGEADPNNHCAINVALYGDGARRWTLTERGRHDLQQGADTLVIGPSQVQWDGDCLTVEIRERAAPLPFPVRGRVRVRPAALTSQDFALDGDATAEGGAGRHRWWPIAPCARVELEFESPALRWSGPGYFDMNAGLEPLEQGFASWDWCRADLGGETAILYDTRPLGGGGRSIAAVIDAAGGLREIDPPPRVALPTTAIWRIERGTRCEAGFSARIASTLEDTPFYARSLVQTQLEGQVVTAVHESLSLRRFAAPWVQLLLPFRMPRIAATG